MPMLEEHEWERIEHFQYGHVKKAAKYAREHKCSIPEAQKSVGKEAIDIFKEMTGIDIGNFNAIWHHRLSDYGPECDNCGHLYRTPKAKLCANCGNKRLQNGSLTIGSS